MPQLFAPSANTLIRAVLGGVVLLTGAVALGSYRLYWSDFTTQVGQPVQQPVPFSHHHHVSGLGIDCRYCHTGVETSAFAGLPPTETCMTCHSQVWRDAPVLEPVRESWRTGQPLHWQRVNDLPDYVYFNHSIHVAKGVACTTCHGPVGDMPLTWKGHSLYMRWCLQCHRDPEPKLVGAEHVFDGLPGAPPANPHASLNHPERLEDCSVCHR